MSLHGAQDGAELPGGCNDDAPTGNDPGACGTADAGMTRDAALARGLFRGDDVLVRVSRYGVNDGADAFPLDPAASVDTDGDGYPDAWNPGRTEADSTTGLQLDFFPTDPTRARPAGMGGVFQLLLLRP